jgi:hypothetical protein
MAAMADSAGSVLRRRAAAQPDTPNAPGSHHSRRPAFPERADKGSMAGILSIGTAVPRPAFSAEVGLPRWA